ncbi:MAG: hypothetical protein HC857_13650 [Synechococcales cyanobacterium RU_4_20]|nr:hypothetical protein [Synechococcales cyanobacterium RU_4_20]NJR68476.1 hypothetical protein [Synechococcales cyanobacterium CRU_2_2]
MDRICDIAQTALATGYLTVDAEDQLRRLLRTKNSMEDLSAFTQLQLAAAAGEIRQESREQIWGQAATSA